MEEIKNKVIDRLYQTIEGDIEKKYEKEYGKQKEAQKTVELREELVEFFKKFVTNEKEIEELNKKLNEYDLSVMNTLCFWYKLYYKAGFLDGINLKEEIKGGLI